MVVEISLTKKCYGITEGRTEGRMDGTTDRCKPVYPPTFSKWRYNNTDRQMDSSLNRTTDSCKPVYTHLFSKRGYKNSLFKIWKENRINTGKNKHEKAGLQSHDTIHHYQPAYHIGLL